MSEFEQRRTARDDRIRRAAAERNGKVAAALSMHAGRQIDAERALSAIREAYEAYEVAEQAAWDAYRAGDGR